MKSLLLFVVTLTTVGIGSNLQCSGQKVQKDGHVIITYDLAGEAEGRYNIFVTATNADGAIIAPHAIAGDVHMSFSGKKSFYPLGTSGSGWSISFTGWNVSLSAKAGIGIDWVFVQGGPAGGSTNIQNRSNIRAV